MVNISTGLLPDQHAPLVTFGLHRLPEALREGRNYVSRQFDRQKVEQVRHQRLSRLLTHATQMVPYYRSLKIDQEQVRKDPLLALKQFPVLTKQDFQRQPMDFISDDVGQRPAFKVSTSGSTGVPLEIVDDEDSLIDYASAYLRLTAAYGLSLGDKMANVIADGARAQMTLEAQLLAGLSDTLQINLLDRNSRPYPDAFQTLREFRPKAIFGNPTDLFLLAQTLPADCHIGDLKVIVSCGENLLSNWRSLIESRFGCPVAEHYSMQECKSIAWQCPQGAFHINEDRVVVEDIAGDHGQELIVTYLNNLTMPFIRYKTMDVGKFLPASQANCRCGRHLGTIIDFDGRDRGFIQTDDGGYYSPRALKLGLTKLDIAAWQIVQETPDSLEINIAPGINATAQDLDQSIRKLVTEVIQSPLKVDIQIQPLLFFKGDFGRKFQMMRLLKTV